MSLALIEQHARIQPVGLMRLMATQRQRPAAGLICPSDRSGRYAGARPEAARQHGG